MRRMIHAAELFVGLRYLRAKRKTRFVSFITFISLGGIALGVAALIVILSVMNGFEGELRSRLLSMTAHGYVSGADGTVSDWQELRREIVAEPGIVATAPLIEMEGMIRTGKSLTGVLINGVLPEEEFAVSGRMVNFVAGSLDVLRLILSNFYLHYRYYLSSPYTRQLRCRRLSSKALLPMRPKILSRVQS
jgi:lipoprotein-releasing system permease protein